MNVDLEARLLTAAGGIPTGTGLSRRAARALALSSQVGAAAGPALRAAALADAGMAAQRRAVAVATAQSRAVAKGLMALPVVMLVGLDVLLGLPLLGFYASPVGRLVGVGGAGLLALGGLASGALVRRVWSRPAQDGPLPCDEAADLVAAGLLAGLPPPAALRAVADVLGVQDEHAAAELRGGALALEHDRPASIGTPVDDLLALLSFAIRHGAPAADELLLLATEQRARERDRLRERAERLPAQLAVPSVLLLLPANVLVVGAPIVAAGFAPS